MSRKRKEKWGYLGSARDGPYSGEIDPVVFHSLHEEIKGLEPHGDRAGDLAWRTCYGAALGRIVRKIAIKGNNLFVDESEPWTEYDGFEGLGGEVDA